MKYIRIAVPDDFNPENGHKILLDGPEKGECPIWQPEYRDVLDKGFIGLVDFMGDDQSIVNAARVSYGTGTRRVSEDRGLIRYLIRNRHLSPVEMMELMWHVKAPIFVFRQWHRHRAACLAGDVKLSFDLPADVGRSSNRLYTLTVKQLYEKFQPTCSIKRPDRQRNSYFKRDRVRSMMLRSCDEDSLSPYHTQIVNIWESGVKPVLQVEFEHGGVLRATGDHRCFTNLGWLRLTDAISSKALFAGADRMSTGTDQRLSVVFVKPVSVQEDGEEMTYDIEVLGPYHNFLAGGVYVHNSINEYSGRYSVMSEDMYMPDIDALKPQSKTNKQGREGELNMNNACAVQLQLEHVFKDCAQAYQYLLGTTGVPSASLNQRYDFIKQFAIDRIKWLEQSDPAWNPELVTEQMVEEKITEIVAANGLSFTDQEFAGPDGTGLSRELARICLPVATYSEMYWKSDLRNTFNFISLRSDPHAQHEIKVYSDLMLEMIEPIAPICVAAFVEYQLKGRQFSSMELAVVRQLYQNKGWHDGSENDQMISEIMSTHGASKREIHEFLDTLNQDI